MLTENQKALEQVCSELMSPPQPRGDENSARLEQLSSLASAVLILNLSEMTGASFTASFPEPNAD